RLGTEGTMTFALLLLTAGILLRVIPSNTSLFLGTVVLGIGIALGNVLLPGIVKKRFPQNIGIITGIYSAMLGAGAAIASGISVPLSENWNFGWRWALGAWAVFSFFALLIWLPQMRENRTHLPRRSLRGSLKQLGGSKLAWHIAVFMGLQSLTFYIIITWLPDILIELNISPVRAGWMMALIQATGATGTLVMPYWASRRQRQRLPVFIIMALELISIAGLMIPFQTHFMITLWVVILGFSLGSSFGMALLFIGLRARDTDSVNELSGMSQSAGYTLAAAGPALFGAFHDLVQNWTVPLALLLFITIIKLWAGWKAGHDDYV
ncbi:MAG: MFS transporter, partial [Balneolaceae bacterium]